MFGEPSAATKRLEAHVRDRASTKALHALALSLQRETLTGPEAVSHATAKALRTVVSGARFSTLGELIETIKAAGAFLQDAQPREQTIGNVTRRVLFLLREEARAANLMHGSEEYGSSSVIAGLWSLKDYGSHCHSMCAAGDVYVQFRMSYPYFRQSRRTKRKSILSRWLIGGSRFESECNNFTLFWTDDQSLW